MIFVKEIIKMRKFLKINLLLFILTSSFLSAQEINKLYSFGLNSTSVLYSEKDASVVGGRYIAFIPGISISKYLGNKITVSAMFSKSMGDNQNYFSSDFNLTYDILNPKYSLRTYVLAGMGLVSLIETDLTLNIGGGATWWISDKIGLNGQLVYKLNPLNGEFQKPHFFGSAGLIYSFDFSDNTRLWD